MLRPLFLFLGLLLTALPAFAIDCPQHKLPRPTEDHAVTKARLESQGLWQKNRSVPENPQLGDTWDWYIWDLGGFPVATLKPCTIRGVGENVFVVVDDDEWNVGGMDQAAVDRIIAHFDHQSVGPFPDQGIWDLNTSHFGEPPNNLDGQEKIFLLYYRFNISSDGYFWIFDQYPDGTQPWASNEADVVYLATDNGDPGGDYMLAVAAHEFQHLIHFNTDQNEDSWVDEGMGELAMWLFGNPDGITGFYTNPDNDLTEWTGAWADYIKTYLWTLYVYEKYGGQDLIWNVCHNPLNGMEGYRTSLQDIGYPDPNMGDIFGDWSMANYLDDTTIGDGRYGYEGEDLPYFWAWRVITSTPANGSGSISPWAGEHMRILNLDAPLGITFDGNDAHDYRVFVTSRASGLPTFVQPVTLGDRNVGRRLHEAGYSEAVLTVANVNGSAGSLYTYDLGNDLVHAPDTPTPATALTAYPNPFNPATVLRFRIENEAHCKVRIHDGRGRLVRLLHDGLLTAGEATIDWNAAGLSSGVYFGSLEVDGRVVSIRKLTLVR